MSLVQLAGEIRSGVISPREAVQAQLERIERFDSVINSFISVRAEEALAEAASPVSGPLRGVPIAVKDVIDVAGARTTAASAILAHNVARHDALAVARLRQAGAVIIGKLNTHEFAWGSSSTSRHFGPVRNPWALERIAGGSSGGSGAAVAARLVPGSLGTDTGGSIRIPSSFCGVTGLRPSMGLVPTQGTFPVSQTFDVVGPMAATAEDCGVVLDAIAGTRTDVRGGIAGLKVGVVTALLDLASDDVAATVTEAVGVLNRLGARIEPMRIPMLIQAGTIQQLIMLPEATAVHLRWLQTRLSEYGDDVRARLLAGLFLPATSYVTALRARAAYRAALDRTFSGVDVVVAPTMPIVPPDVGANIVTIGGTALPYREAVIPFNSPWSLGGLPVVSVPCGFVNGLPVGLAVAGRPGADELVLRAGHALQGETDWHERVPPGFA
jgi:aspartyl-tRNA(Asn)/glutamyl-tRNA(Gln) amidotransferase subunit A